MIRWQAYWLGLFVALALFWACVGAVLACKVLGACP